MEWWHKIVFPIKRVCSAVFLRVKRRENGAGLLKLRDDIQTCGYEDVQIMWEMLRTESEVTPHNKGKYRWFWKNLAWPSCGAAKPSPAPPSRIELNEEFSVV